jgi:hypothetical protein
MRGFFCGLKQQFTAGFGVVSCIIHLLLLGNNQQLLISKLPYLSLPWLPRCEERAISLVTCLLYLYDAPFFTGQEALLTKLRTC